jgi:hypothetical protein
MDAAARGGGREQARGEGEHRDRAEGKERTSQAPAMAPAAIAATASSRLASVTWPRRPGREPAPIPVSVMVSTVVARSGTASVRAAEPWMPVAVAASRRTAWSCPVWPAEPWQQSHPGPAAGRRSRPGHSAATALRRAGGPALGDGDGGAALLLASPVTDASLLDYVPVRMPYRCLTTQYHCRPTTQHWRRASSMARTVRLRRLAPCYVGLWLDTRAARGRTCQDTRASRRSQTWKIRSCSIIGRMRVSKTNLWTLG